MELFEAIKTTLVDMQTSYKKDSPFRHFFAMIFVDFAMGYIDVPFMVT